MPKRKTIESEYEKIVSRKKPLHKFLRADDISNAIDEISSKAKAEKIDIALIGGVAMQLYGSDRLTMDVDIVASKLPESFGKGKTLSIGGASFKTKSGCPVDVVVRSDRYSKLYEKARRTARPESGLPIKVVRAEYMVALKMAAHRPKDNLDLHALLSSGMVDIPLAKLIVCQHLGHYAQDDLDSILLEIRMNKKMQTAKWQDEE